MTNEGQPECPTCGDPTDIDGRPCRACNVFMRQVKRERTDRTDKVPVVEAFDGELPF
jgi:tRNA(Ile2) C34 agmatinyltransferase TiaS